MPLSPADSFSEDIDLLLASIGVLSSIPHNDHSVQFKGDLSHLPNSFERAPTPPPEPDRLLAGEHQYLSESEMPSSSSESGSHRSPLESNQSFKYEPNDDVLPSKLTHAPFEDLESFFESMSPTADEGEEELHRHRPPSPHPNQFFHNERAMSMREHEDIQTSQENFSAEVQGAEAKDAYQKERGGNVEFPNPFDRPSTPDSAPGNNLYDLSKLYDHRPIQQRVRTHVRTRSEPLNVVVPRPCANLPSPLCPAHPSFVDSAGRRQASVALPSQLRHEFARQARSQHAADIHEEQQQHETPPHTSPPVLEQFHVVNRPPSPLKEKDEIAFHQASRPPSLPVSPQTLSQNPSPVERQTEQSPVSPVVEGTTAVHIEGRPSAHRNFSDSQAATFYELGFSYEIGRLDKKNKWKFWSKGKKKVGRNEQHAQEA